jgi:dolichol kinase
MHPQTWLGSAACFLAAWGATAALLQHFRRQGLMLEGVSTAQLLAGSAASSLVAAVVESLPLSAADNITMPLAAALTALWWFAGAGSSMVPAAAAAAAKVALE